MYDIRVFVDCTREVCRERVIRRNFAAGIVESLDKCAERGESGRVGA
jgi:uridine kinase